MIDPNALDKLIENGIRIISIKNAATLTMPTWCRMCALSQMDGCLSNRRSFFARHNRSQVKCSVPSLLKGPLTQH